MLVLLPFQARVHHKARVGVNAAHREHRQDRWCGGRGTIQCFNKFAGVIPGSPRPAAAVDGVSRSDAAASALPAAAAAVVAATAVAAVATAGALLPQQRREGNARLVGVSASRKLR